MTITRLTTTTPVILLLLAFILIGCAPNDTLDQSLTASTEILEIAHSDSGDPARGESLFRHGIGVETVPACINCHAFRQGALMLGPIIVGIGQRAALRVPDLSAAEYLRQSILEPSAFLVPGYANRMFADYRDHFSDQDIADLIAYLQTL